jgi:RNA polymerase sigma-70 factor (ECF subfamily)
MKNTNEEDLKVLEELKAGNANAFSYLYKRYRAHIYSKAFQMLKRQDLAHDATQDILIKVYHKVLEGKYQPIFTFNAWVTSVRDNHLKDELRKNKNNPVHNGISLDEIQGEEDSVSVEKCLFEIANELQTEENASELENNKQALMLKLIRETLSEKDQEILLLHMENVPQHKIAKIVNLEYRNVRLRIHRLKHQLAALVSKFKEDNNYELT